MTQKTEKRLFIIIKKKQEGTHVMFYIWINQKQRKVVNRTGLYSVINVNYAYPSMYSN